MRQPLPKQLYIVACMLLSDYLEVGKEFCFQLQKLKQLFAFQELLITWASVGKPESENANRSLSPKVGS